VDAKVAAGYEQLFHGAAEETVYYEAGADQAYILDANNNDVRSEGMSYGMTISVLLDHREEYDRLWRWSRERMYESSGQYAGYFSWRTTTQGAVTGGPSAPDGEEYFATALILASKKWGDGEGIFNYGQEARNLLAALTTKGNFNPQEYLVKFGPTSNYSDPSYVLPAFYELWACFDPQTQAFWKSAATAGRQHLQRTTNATTGLAPYLSNFDGSPYSGGGNFNSDSWRVVGNIMMDHYLFGVDPWQPTFAEKYAAFFVEHQIQPQQTMAYEFSLDGNPLVRGDNVIEGLVAQNAFVAYGTSPEVATPYVQQLWDLAPPTGIYRYYDGMLYLFGLLHLSGNFRLE
jgi:oligosaccharide reducing-end xylanase